MPYDWMEFYINLGVVGLVGGFVLLGWLIGFLDLRAASAERRGDLGWCSSTSCPPSQ